VTPERVHRDSMLNGMTLKMAGRVILPKQVRDWLGLHEGTDLEVVETSQGIVLKPVEPPSVNTQDGNRWPQISGN
jgi:AbrB family looped-hinge helix DNA binding protein